MGIEIERRFLVENEDWKSEVLFSQDFSQGYLNSNSDIWAIRVRIIDNKKAYLTLKSSIDGFLNHEFEYPIPNQDAFELLKLSEHQITKTRYQLKVNQKNWVVDSFSGSNTSLKIAEIELNSEFENIKVPAWCGQEITGIKSLSNASLAKTPITKLAIKDRIETNKDL